VVKLIKVCSLIVFSYALGAKDLPATDVVVLKPEMRAEPLSKALYTIQTGELINYFQNIVLFDKKDDMDKLPYVLGFDRDKNMGGTGDIAFVIGINGNDNISAFTLIKFKKKLEEPGTGKLIGYKADVLGEAEVIQLGPVTSSVMITNMKSNIEPGARLIPRIGLDLQALIEVKPPEVKMAGYILETVEEQVGSGAYSVVTIDLGQKHGLVQGSILDLVEDPRPLLDPYTNKKTPLPMVKFGEVVIYKVADKFSLGIIAHANRPVLPHDRVISIPPGP